MPNRIIQRSIFCAACLLLTAACRETGVAAPRSVSMTPQELAEKTRRELVEIKGGTFQMGDFGEIHSEEKLPYSYQQEDGPLHLVTVSDFAILKNKVTIADYEVYAGAVGLPPPYTERTPSLRQKIALRHPRMREFPIGLDWQEAKNYCKWLGSKVGRTMDLPTEAEWEFAARNRGGLIIFPTADGENKSGVHFASSSQSEAFTGFATGNMPVAMYPPTTLGLFDLAANGSEWTNDWYSPVFYASSHPNNPQGPTTGTERTIRGRNNGDDTAAMTFERTGQLPVSPESKPAGYNSNKFRCVARTSTAP